MELRFLEAQKFLAVFVFDALNFEASVADAVETAKAAYKEPAFNQLMNLISFKHLD